MKNEKLLRAIGQIDDELIEDAVICPSQKKQPFVKTPACRRGAAIAACFALVIGLICVIPTVLPPAQEMPPDLYAPVPGTAAPVTPGTLPPPSVQEDSLLLITGIDKLSYYAAVRMIQEGPASIAYDSSGGSRGISLLTNGSGTDKTEVPPEPETTGPQETEGPAVTPERPEPPDLNEDIYYYALDPAEHFYVNRVSVFQIELTDENGFLASRLGLGIVDVAIVENCLWGDSLITFRNGERFYSCLTNGWSLNENSLETRWDFSTHKYADGFFIVKNFEQENYAFYIDMDAQGQAIDFNCEPSQNGGHRPDQNIRIVSSTLISEESRSFTVAELETYFNRDQTTPAAFSDGIGVRIGKQQARRV